MNEGLIGLIIMIAIFNIGARILKSLSAPKKLPKVPPPGAEPGTPTGLAEDDPRTKYYDEAEIARIRETAQPFPEKVTIPTPEKLLEEVLDYAKDKIPGDFAKWDEAAFEQEPAAPAYEPEPVREIHPTAELPSYTEKAERTVPDVIEGPKGIHRGAYKQKVRKPAAVALEDISSDLQDVEQVRKAIVLSTVLGPCKAKSRRRQ
jgi:hypothetical protein